MATVGIREVAEAAGVSTATVSNTLNRPQRVAASTRARVQRVIDELGYTPDAAARSLSSGQGSGIGLIVFDVRNPFLTDVARGVEDMMHTLNSVVMLCNSDVDAQKEQRYLTLLTAQRIRGVLINPVNPTREWLEAQHRRGLRVVLLDNVNDLPGVCSVAVDDVAGADQAVTHLLARGHQKIVFVTGPASMRQSADRLAGSLRALDRAGLPHSALTVMEMPAFTADQGRRAGELLISQGQWPRGVFCANDLLALGLLQVAVRANVSVPGQLAIVGYDDIDAAATAAVPLTSVHVDGYELGRGGARLLAEELHGSPGHQHTRIVFEPELVERSST